MTPPRSFRRIFYLIICAGLLMCRSGALAQVGTNLWSLALNDPVLASPVIGPDGTIYATPYENIYALTPGGSNKWVFPATNSAIYPGIFGSPSVGADGTVYFGGAVDGVLYAVDAATGTNKWKYVIIDNDTGNKSTFYSSPAIGSDGTIYIGSYPFQKNDVPYLYAINTNGTLRWRFPTVGKIGIYSSPSISRDGATIYFGCDDGKLYAIGTNGTTTTAPTPRWTFNTGIKAITATPSIGADGRIYIGVGSVLNPKFYCVNTNGTTNWVFTCTNRIKSSAAIGRDGTVYFGSDDMRLYALNPNGTLKWSFFTGAANGSSPAIAADGTVYFGSDNGKLYAFNSNGSNLWSFQGSLAMASSPVLGTNGTIYVGTGPSGGAVGNFYAVGGNRGLDSTAAWPMFRHDERHTARAMVPNAPPTISAIGNQTNYEDTVFGPLVFTIGDAETDVSYLNVTGSSSNTTLVANGQIQITGTTASRSVGLTPATNQFGTTLITLTVTDTNGASTSTNFLFVVQPVNDAPDLPFIADKIIGEGNLLVFTNVVTDVELPAQTLTFSLLSAPTNAMIDPVTGIFTWTPAEAPTDSTNLITLTVTDNGSPPLSATQSFTVFVLKTNSAPLLLLPAPQTVDELTTLNVQATATDLDLPTNTLTFELVAGPAGLTVFSHGLISWTPTEAQGPSTNSVTVRVFDDGLPSLSVTSSFVVVVHEVNTLPTLTPLTNWLVYEGYLLTFTNAAADADLPAQALTFSLASAPTNAVIDPVTGVFTWTSSEVLTITTNTILIVVSDSGLPSLSATQSFTVVVRKTNNVPVLTLPTTQTVDELTAMNVTATATDQDVPANTLTFELVAGPDGLTVSSNGLISWTPTEAQGPSTNNVTVRLFDDGVPSLGTTQSFTVIVNESNTPPTLSPVANQSLDEGGTLVLTNVASDADLLAQTLTFSLIGGPPGATNDPVTGVFTWTPSESQGPSTNTIFMVVTDDGVPNLSTTQSFTVIVQEVNASPVLAPVADQTVFEGVTLTLTNVVGDADLPAQTLTYSLLNAPTNAEIDPVSGVFTWTPDESQGGSTNLITIVVTDASLSATQSFTVVVNEVNLPPFLSPIPNRTVHLGTTVNFNLSATDPDSPTNILTFSLNNAPTGANVHASTGAFTWTADQVATNLIDAVVTDNGLPPLSATNTFTIIVVAPPTILLLNSDPDSVIVTWSSIPQANYRLQYKSNLNDFVWIDLTGDIHATGDTATRTNTRGADTSRFYRVMLLP